VTHLRKHPTILDGLRKGVVIGYDIGGDGFHVLVTGKHLVEAHPAHAESPAVELIFSRAAMEQLSLVSEDDYAAQSGKFFKEPTDGEWIRFGFRPSAAKLVLKGNGRFAQKAGLI